MARINARENREAYVNFVEDIRLDAQELYSMVDSDGVRKRCLSSEEVERLARGFRLEFEEQVDMEHHVEKCANCQNRVDHEQREVLREREEMNASIEEVYEAHLYY
ncbi:MAG TPA: hypothetical protein VEC17_03215 [Candidatus Binatia bacterium]|nr:hypothetical protein [Candidatus Binatia bacterium]